MSLDDVRKYYARYDEWGRLERSAGRLEFERSVGVSSRMMNRIGKKRHQNR